MPSENALAPLLHEVFEKSAEDYPENIAVESVEENVFWSYKYLDENSTKLAWLLYTIGVRPDDFIGVFLPRCAYFYLCMLSILKSGGAYVSIDPEYPADRIQHIINDSNSKIILVDDGEAINLMKRGHYVILELNEENDFIFAHDKSKTVQIGETPILIPLGLIVSWLKNQTRYNGGNKITRELTHTKLKNACYAIFTSGSTGKPKGVCLEHRSVVNFIFSEQLSFPSYPYDRVLQGFSTCFDASVEEIWLAFSSGATLVVGSKELMRSGPLLGLELEKRKITIFSTVPTVLRICENIPSPPLLRIVITGGEACPPEVVSKWISEGRKFLNTYGPTEATVIATMTELKIKNKVSIGKAIPGYSCHIVNENNEPCDVNVPGELLLGGCSVARGYINRDDLNPLKFVLDPFHAPIPNYLLYDWRDYFGKKNESRTRRENVETLKEDFLKNPEKYYTPKLYKSGDLCKFDSNGNIEFLGRIDSQVKIRGYRVELNEIETVICSHPFIEQCCVVARTDIEGQKGQVNLVAYVSSKKNLVTDIISNKSETNLLSNVLKSPLPMTYNAPAGFNSLPECVMSPEIRPCALSLPNNVNETQAMEQNVNSKRNNIVHSLPEQEALLENCSFDFDGTNVKNSNNSLQPAVYNVTSINSSNNEDVKSRKSKKTDENETSVNASKTVSPLLDNKKSKYNSPSFEGINILRETFSDESSNLLYSESRVKKRKVKDNKSSPARENLSPSIVITENNIPTNNSNRNNTDCISLKKLSNYNITSPAYNITSPQQANAIILDLENQMQQTYHLTPLAIRTHCTLSLPGYMIPSRYVFLDSIPLMPSGKVDRKKIESLPSPDNSSLPVYVNEDNDNAECMLETPTEEFVALLWKNILGCNNINSNDDFFDLGGNSLSAAQFISKVRMYIPNCPLAVRDIYETLVLRVLSERLEQNLSMALLDINTVIQVAINEYNNSNTEPKKKNVAFNLPDDNNTGRVTNVTSGSSNVSSDMYLKKKTKNHITSKFKSIFSASTVSTKTEFTSKTDVSSLYEQLSQIDSEENKFRKNVWLLFERIFVQSFQLVLLFVNAMYSLAWSIGYIILLYFLKDTLELNSILIALIFPCLYFIHTMTNLFVSILLKWLILGKVKEGNIRLWSIHYLRWWFVKTWIQSIDLSFFTGTKYLNIILRLLGSKIGKNVHINSRFVGLMNYDLLTINDNTIINTGVYIKAYEVQNGIIEKRKIIIESNCIIGNTCYISRGSKIGSNSELLNGTNVTTNAIIPSYQIWHDSPCEFKEQKLIMNENKNLSDNNVSQKINTFINDLCFFAHWIFTIILLDFIQYAPRAILFLHMFFSQSFNNMIPYIVLLALWSYVFAPTLLLIIYKKLLFPFGIKEGKYKLYSFWYYKFWSLHYIKNRHIVNCHPIYSTIYTSTFLKLLGCKIGKNVEISDALDFTPDLINIEKNCFIADAVNLAPYTVSLDKYVILNSIYLSEKTFIGNNSLVPMSTYLPKGNLLGVMSVAPTNKKKLVDNKNESVLKENTSYLGVCPFVLPNRSVVIFNDNQTINPSKKMIILRGLIELYRCICCGLIIELTFLFCWYLYKVLYNTLINDYNSILNSIPISNTIYNSLSSNDIYTLSGVTPSVFWLLVIFPSIIVIYCLIIATVVLLHKWILIGVHKECNYPLWSVNVWLIELLTTLCDDCAYKIFGRALSGTVFLPFWFRLLGCKIGSNVYIDTPYLLEHDLINISSNVCLDENATIQTHLFEDRVMKLGKIYIGKNCSVGCRSVILYSTYMNNNSTLCGMSLMMKGEAFGVKQVFAGVPAVPIHCQKKK